MSPRARRSPAVPPAPDAVDDTGEPGAADEAEQADNELAELRHQLPEGAMMTLWRMVEGGDKEFVDEQAVSEFSIPWVKERFGGGRYIIYLRKPDPNAAGRWIRQGSKKFRIIGPPRTVADVVPGTAPGQTTEEFMRKYAEMIDLQMTNQLKGQDMLHQMQLAVLKNLTDRPTDPMSDLFKAALLKMLDKPAAPQLTLADVIALSDKIANKTSGVSQFKDVLDMAKAARELTGDRESNPPWMELAGRGLDVLGRAFTGAEPAKQLPSGDPAPEAGPPPQPAAAQVPDTMHPLFKFLQPQIPTLIRHAIADHDPDTYAGVIFDQIAPQHYTDLLGVIDDSTFLAKLNAAFPAIGTTVSTTQQPIAYWFEDLRQDLVERLREGLGMPNDDPDPNTP